MGITERKQRQKEEVRSLILDTAWRIVIEEGWGALSIRKIADAIEYSAPVIYDHFTNKEAILFEFTKRGFRQLNEELLQARDQFDNPARQLEAMAYAYWRFAFNNTHYYQIMYGLGMPTCETVEGMPELKTLTGLFSEPITKLAEANPDKEIDWFLKLQTFWSTLHGLVSIKMSGHEKSREEMNLMILKDFINSFLAGFKS